MVLLSKVFFLSNNVTMPTSSCTENEFLTSEIVVLPSLKGVISATIYPRAAFRQTARRIPILGACCIANIDFFLINDIAPRLVSKSRGRLEDFPWRWSQYISHVFCGLYQFDWSWTLCMDICVTSWRRWVPWDARSMLKVSKNAFPRSNEG